MQAREARDTTVVKVACDEVAVLHAQPTPFAVDHVARTRGYRGVDRSGVRSWIVTVHRGLSICGIGPPQNAVMEIG